MLIQQTIISFIQQKTDTNTVNLNDNLLSKIKSFDFMLLIIELEQKFNLQLPFEQALSDSMSKISQFIQWVEQHQTCEQNHEK